jgi:hypothetical protein
MSDIVQTVLSILGGGAALVAAAAFIAKKWVEHQFVKELEDYKGLLGRGQLLFTKVLETRLPAYRELWALSGRIAASGRDDINAAEQALLASELREWYYRDGHGLVLSSEASHLLRAAMGTLREAEPHNTAAVRKLMSRLRTTLKTDLNVYGQDTGESIDDAMTASKAP